MNRLIVVIAVLGMFTQGAGAQWWHGVRDLPAMKPCSDALQAERQRLQAELNSKNKQFDDLLKANNLNRGYFYKENSETGVSGLYVGGTACLVVGAASTSTGLNLLIGPACALTVGIGGLMDLVSGRAISQEDIMRAKEAAKSIPPKKLEEIERAHLQILALEMGVKSAAEMSHMVKVERPERPDVSNGFREFFGNLSISRNRVRAIDYEEMNTAMNTLRADPNFCKDPKHLPSFGDLTMAILKGRNITVPPADLPPAVGTDIDGSAGMKD